MGVSGGGLCGCFPPPPPIPSTLLPTPLSPQHHLEPDDVPALAQLLRLEATLLLLCVLHPQTHVVALRLGLHEIQVGRGVEGGGGSRFAYKSSCPSLRAPTSPLSQFPPLQTPLPSPPTPMRRSVLPFMPPSLQPLGGGAAHAASPSAAGGKWGDLKTARDPPGAPQRPPPPPRPLPGLTWLARAMRVDCTCVWLVFSKRSLASKMSWGFTP